MLELFTANDRCDRCLAQAYHVANKGEFELYFCNHHYHENEDALLITGWEVTSDIGAINRLGNPMDVSANA